jgi:hypothetical protein
MIDEIIDMEGMPVFEFFKNLLHKKDGLLTTYCMTTVRDVRAEFLDRMPRDYWTFENCLESAKKYNTISEWSSDYEYAYKCALMNNWLEKCTEHMINLPSSWTKEKCLESALKYKSIKDWDKNEPNAVSASRRNGWQNECTVHMNELKKIPNYWTKEKCLESAKNCVSGNDWQIKDGGAYRSARRNGWLNECRLVMKNSVIKNALQYDAVNIWQKKETGVYQFAKKWGGLMNVLHI